MNRFAAPLAAAVFTMRAPSPWPPHGEGCHLHAAASIRRPDRVTAQWIGRDGGQPSSHSPTFNLARKKA